MSFKDFMAVRKFLAVYSRLSLLNSESTFIFQRGHSEFTAASRLGVDMREEGSRDSQGTQFPEESRLEGGT